MRRSVLLLLLISISPSYTLTPHLLTLLSALMLQLLPAEKECHLLVTTLSGAYLEDEVHARGR